MIKKKLHNDLEEVRSNFPPKYYSNIVKFSYYRSIFLCEDLTKQVAETICALLIYYDQINSDEITLWISSNGGDASGLIAIADCIKLLSSPLKTICLSRAYSAGAVLLAMGTKGKRYALKNSELMLHGIQCLFPGIGKEHPVDSNNYYKFLHQDNNYVMKILSDCSGKSLDEIKELCKKDAFMTPKEGIELGIIDAILK